MVQQFTTALKEAVEPAEGIEFEVDGILLTAYQPDTAQFAVLLSGFGKHSSQAEQIATFIDFFGAILDRKSSTYVLNRLLDREDPFGVEELAAIGEWLIEEWGGFPTPSSSDSPQSGSTGTTSSKRRTTKSTSSRSRSASG